jgi:hypothetical protein
MQYEENYKNKEVVVKFTLEVFEEVDSIVAAKITYTLEWIQQIEDGKFVQNRMNVIEWLDVRDGSVVQGEARGSMELGSLSSLKISMKQRRVEGERAAAPLL